MDFEDQEDEQEGDLGLPGPNYNDTRPKPIETTPPPPQPPQQQLRKSRYRECLKNHAVSIGGHAVDGCGEFIPAGEDGTLESLKCAACNCHRNFHRKEIVPFIATPHHHQQLLLPHHHHHFGYRGGPSGYLHVAGQQRPLGQGLLALPSSSGGGGADDQMEDNNYYSNNPSSSGGSGKKRVRTKFTQEQKDRMLGFAERLGWRIQKQDEEAVQQFCGELGIKRHVLKVWMHNNKHTLGKKVLGGGGTNYTTNSES